MDAAWLLPLAYAGLCAMVFVPLESLAPLRSAQRTRWTTDVLFATVGALMVHGLLALAAGLTPAGAATLPPRPFANAPSG